MRKEGFEKPKQIAPRGELFIEEPERRLSLRATISVRSPQDSAPQTPMVAKKPKKAAFRERGQRGKGMIPNEYKVACSPDRVGVWF